MNATGTMTNGMLDQERILQLVAASSTGSPALKSVTSAACIRCFQKRLQTVQQPRAATFCSSEAAQFLSCVNMETFKVIVMQSDLCQIEAIYFFPRRYEFFNTLYYSMLKEIITTAPFSRHRNFNVNFNYIKYSLSRCRPVYRSTGPIVAVASHCGSSSRTVLFRHKPPKSLTTKRTSTATIGSLYLNVIYSVHIRVDNYANWLCTHCKKVGESRNHPTVINICIS